VLWIQETAERFWSRVPAGVDRDRFPRDLRRAIALSVPLAVITLPELRIDIIDAWLKRRGMLLGLRDAERHVRACLIAFQGTGIVFLDGADPEDEQRFSLAHELAHFLVGHLSPREEVVRRLGEHGLDLVDGRRAPTVSDRVDAVLSGIGHRQVQVHMLERPGPDWDPWRRATTHAREVDADGLALELLVPEDVARASITGLKPDEATARLSSTFGLPTPVAFQFAHRLLSNIAPAAWNRS
jgi:uncharacterized protein DUF955